MWRWVLRRLGFEQTQHIEQTLSPLVIHRYAIEEEALAKAFSLGAEPAPPDQLFRRALLVLHRLHAAEWRRYEAQMLYLVRTSVFTPEAEARGLPSWWYEADAILREAGWEVET